MKWTKLALAVASAGVLAGLLAGCSARSGSMGEAGRDDAPAESVDSREREFGAGPEGAAADAQGRISEEDMTDAMARRLEQQLQDVFFAFDRFDLSWESRQALAANARVLRENPGVRLVVEGHCDERGTNEYNIALGERRARAARDYLVQSGIAPSRLSIISYGEERPFALGHDESAWAQNRRAHFRVRSGF